MKVFREAIFIILYHFVDIAIFAYLLRKIESHFQNKFLKEAKTYEQALLIFTKMKNENLIINKSSYIALFEKAKTSKQVFFIFREMKRKNFTPNEGSYNILISKADRFDRAFEIFQEMKRKNLTPNEGLCNVLINKAPNYNEAFLFFEEMKVKGLQPNEVSYSTLISKAPNYNEAFLFFEEMKVKGLQPNEISYSTLISKAPNYNEAFLHFEEMKVKGLQPNEISYSTLISKAPNYDEALSSFQEMKDNGLQPNEFLYSTLLSKAESYGQAFYTFKEMKSKGFQLNEISYSTLINKAPNYNEAFNIFEEMKTKGLQPNIVSLNTLISKAKNFHATIPLLKELAQSNTIIEEGIIATLISKTTSFDDFFKIEEIIGSKTSPFLKKIIRQIQRLQAKLKNRSADVIGTFSHNIGQKIGATLNDIASLKLFLKRNNIFEKELFEGDKEEGTIGELLEGLETRVEATTQTLDTITRVYKGDIQVEPTDLATFFSEQKETYSNSKFDIHVHDHIKKKVKILVDKEFLVECIDLLIKNAQLHGFNSDTKHNILFELSLISSVKRKKYVKISYKNDGKPFPKGFAFKNFIQLGERQGKNRGTGIGGYLINQMILLHDGIFRCGNLTEDNYNIHFEILLPITDKKL